MINSMDAGFPPIFTADAQLDFGAGGVLASLFHRDPGQAAQSLLVQGFKGLKGEEGVV
ncbi:MAG: hypothetical protein V1793_12170 [Pseudomonadota bacterium]